MQGEETVIVKWFQTDNDKETVNLQWVLLQNTVWNQIRDKLKHELIKQESKVKYFLRHKTSILYCTLKSFILHQSIASQYKPLKSREGRSQVAVNFTSPFLN